MPENTRRRTNRGNPSRGRRIVNVHPEKASFGPGRRFRFFAILEIATLYLLTQGLLRRRLQKCSGLALNQNLPFPDGHKYHIKISA